MTRPKSRLWTLFVLAANGIAAGMAGGAVAGILLGLTILPVWEGQGWGFLAWGLAIGIGAGAILGLVVGPVLHLLLSALGLNSLVMYGLAGAIAGFLVGLLVPPPGLASLMGLGGGLIAGTVFHRLTFGKADPAGRDRPRLDIEV